CAVCDDGGFLLEAGGGADGAPDRRPGSINRARCEHVLGVDVEIPAAGVAPGDDCPACTIRNAGGQPLVGARGAEGTAVDDPLGLTRPGSDENEGCCEGEEKQLANRVHGGLLM